MNICLFTPSFLPKLGGMEIVLDKLARAFRSAGHDVLVLGKRPRGRGDLPRLPYEVVYYPRTRSNVWFLRPVHAVLLREHRKHKFDIVNAHSGYPTGYVAVRLRGKLGVPVVVTSHMGDIRRFRRRIITRRRLCWTLRNADAVTGVSSDVKRLLDELTANQVDSTVIPNGVDIPDEAPTPTPDKFADLTGKPFLLTMGRLHYYKGLDVLLSALGLLGRQGREVPHLVIAGDGREAPRLEELAQELELIGSVSFVGTVLDDEKDWLLRNCRLLLQPSREEGMPLAVLEAMAYGKAVIGTDVGGIRDMVIPGKTGLLIPSESSQHLAEAIDSLRDNAELEAMASNGRKRALEHSWVNVARSYLETYDDLLCSRRGQPVRSRN